MLKFILIVLLLAGCTLVEVNMVQRDIVDKGDDTKDVYSKDGDTKEESDALELVVPIK